MGFRRRLAAILTVVQLILAIALPALAGDAMPGAVSVRPAPVWIRINDVKLVRVRGGVEVHILGSGPIRAHSRRLSNPERFVLDVQNALFTGDPRTIDVAAGELQSIRVGPLHQQEGRITRIVLELAGAAPLEAVPSGNTLIVRLRTTEAVPASVPPPAMSVVAAAPPLRPAPLPVQPVAYGIAAPSAGKIAEAAKEKRVAVELTELAANAAPESSAERLAAIAEPAKPSENTGSAPPAPPADKRSDDAKEERAVDLPELGATPDAPSEPPAPDSPGAPQQPRIGVGVGITGVGDDQVLGSDADVMDQKKDERKAGVPNLGGHEGSLESLRLSGTATAGYYQMETRNPGVTSAASPVTSVRLDASGFVHSPDFLSFSLKPQASYGRQSSESVFPDGQGVAGSATLLSGGIAPLTVSYTRLTRKLVTFGPTDRLAGLDADTFQNSLGANWRLRLKHAPELNLNFSKYADTYEPLAALAPKTSNSARMYSAELTEKALGWTLQSRFKAERSSQDLVNIFDPSQAPYLYKRKDQDTRFSADRNFGEWLSLAVVGGATKSQNVVQDRPFDQSYQFLTGTSMLRAGKKLTLAMRAGLTNNIVGATLEQATGTGSLGVPQPFLLVPSRAKLQMRSYSATAGYALTKNLRFHADALRETTSAPQDSNLVTPDSALTSGQVGVSYVRRFRFVQVQSDYAANGGRFLYAAGSSRSYGQRGNFGVTVGSLQRLEFTAGLQGSMQNVTGNTYMRDRSWSGNITIARSLGDTWKIRTSYNREHDEYSFANQQFTSNGNGFTVVVLHPRAEFSASHNIRDGLTFQADPRLQNVSSSEAAMLLGAFPGTLIVPTGATWSSASLTIRPAGKFRFRGAWMRSRQRLQTATSNYYTEWETSAAYEFRSLTFDAGYVLHSQNFGVDLFERNRFYFRAVRDFTVH